MNPGSAGRGSGCALVALVLLLGLVVVPLALGAAGGGSPAEWLDDRYERVSGSDPYEQTLVWRAEGDFDQVVNAIVAGTDPDDQTVGRALPSDAPAPAPDPDADPDVDPDVDPGAEPGTDLDDTEAGSPAVFLRYGSDWIVTVIRGDDGTQRIELDEFDRGYRRHGFFFVGIWGGFYNRGGGLFRGGGSGFGK